MFVFSQGQLRQYTPPEVIKVDLANEFVRQLLERTAG